MHVDGVKFWSSIAERSSYLNFKGLRIIYKYFWYLFTLDFLHSNSMDTLFLFDKPDAILLI